MTDPSSHVSSEDLADHDVGLLSAAREAEVSAHLAGCDACAATLDRIRHVSLVLAGSPMPPIPPQVAERLDATLAGLNRTGGSGGPGSSGPASGALVGGLSGGLSGGTDAAGRLRDRVGAGGVDTAALLRAPRPTIGSLEVNLQRHRRRPVRVLGAVLGACAVAGAVGFGGYLLSAVSGHNEPSADTPVVVAGDQLGASSAVTNPSGLSPHRFSDAWNCARKVTDGRITGIETSVVDTTPGLLVYLAGAAGTTRVVFVSGCETEHPSAGPSAVLPHR